MARIHEQFEQTLQLFVPTLHIKVVSVVDVSSTIARIKELRASRPESGVDEEALWEEIKVNTFALVLVCAYSLCALSVLLKIQLHIIASSNVASAPSPSDGSEGKRVFEGTYAFFYDKGIEALYLRLLPIVRDKLSSWRVKEKLGVDYAELVRVLADMRRELEECEGGLGHVLPSILICKSPTCSL